MIKPEKIKPNFILIQPELVQTQEVSLEEKKFWHRVQVLYHAWQDSIHEDMEIIWKWKLISLMKECEFKK